MDERMAGVGTAKSITDQSTGRKEIRRDPF